MSDSVLAALISAGASILVAILNKNQESRKDSGPHNGPPSVVGATPKANTRPWYVASAILLIWLALSPAFVHHDLAGDNFLLIPVVVIVVALVFPTSPLRAAWMSLALFAANFFIGPLSNRLHGSQFDTQFIVHDWSKQRLLLLITFGSSLVAFGICFFRLQLGAHRH